MPHKFQLVPKPLADLPAFSVNVWCIQPGIQLAAAGNL